MPEKSKKGKGRFTEPINYFNISRATQISESHCGPAVIQMLLSNLGIAVTQEAVAEAGGASHLIELEGMRLHQLAEAVRKLASGAAFWYKEHASLKDLAALVNEYHIPVAVEWQGIFDDDDDGLDNDDDVEDETDYGHWSVITYVDPGKRELIIVDPYKDFVSRDRILGFNLFANRWWDINEVPDPRTGRKRYVEDHHLLFVVTTPDATFPRNLGMTRMDSDRSNKKEAA